MKYIKTYKIFESITHSDIEKVKELFYNLSDDIGYVVDVKYSTVANIDFSKYGNVIDSHGVINTIGDPVGSVLVTIRRGGHPFDIHDVIDDVEVAVSYANDVLGFKISNIFVSSPPSFNYYKSNEYLPKNKMISTLSIAFVKK